jgi:predicted kinase
VKLPVPSPPAFSVDWPAVDEACPWLAELVGCQQDPHWHGEGDAAVHTRMVAEQMAALPSWRAREARERELLFLAALMHDLGKPACTRVEPDGRVTSAGHSLKGALRARSILYRQGADPELREAVAWLVRFHQMAFHLLEREDPQRPAFRASLCTRCDHLAILAEADARGRASNDLDKILESVALFRELCREEACFDRPRAFPSAHSRFLYFRTSGRAPEYHAFDDTRCEVVVMSGLPASGKDTWLHRNLPDWPVVSLDELRRELDVDPEDAQGPVVEQARELAREHLRQGRSFALNATSVTRDQRKRWIDLFADYHARVRIVAVEVPLATLLERNRRRPDPVPEKVVDRLIERWETPELSEAHEVSSAQPPPTSFLNRGSR